jgi:hypothetical protein
VVTEHKSDTKPIFLFERSHAISNSLLLQL